MRCPFLREEQVKSCQAAPFRKTLARSAAQLDSERCSSSRYASCPVLRPSREAHPSKERCPFLREALAQFCAATPAVTYVPWSASPEQRCAHDGHRFCPVFLDACGEEGRRPARIPADGPDGRSEDVAGVPMPGWLLYAESHLWLDVGDDGVLHVGIDGFVAQLLGPIERLTFLTVKGTLPPAVQIAARGAELTLRFPDPLRLVAANLRLRARLERLSADPYGSGWLFEARQPSGGMPQGALKQGRAAKQWMTEEVRRVSEWMHAHLQRSRLAADGGRFAADFLEDLAAADVPSLLAAVFTPSQARSTS